MHGVRQFVLTYGVKTSNREDEIKKKNVYVQICSRHSNIGDWLNWLGVFCEKAWQEEGILVEVTATSCPP